MMFDGSLNHLHGSPVCLFIYRSDVLNTSGQVLKLPSLQNKSHTPTTINTESDFDNTEKI